MITSTNRLEQAARIVSAYVSRNALTATALPEFVVSIHSVLEGLDAPPQVLEPAVPIDSSVTPDYIISLESGRRYKTLVKHLTKLGMTPDRYRQKWGLPSDYPMVSANYSKVRSKLAKAGDFGHRGRSGRS